MLTSVHQIFDMPPQDLDDYLERGWFRMQQTIFTTHSIHKYGQPYTTIWLRNRLADFEANSTFKSLAKRNKNFRVSITPFEKTEPFNELYAKYRAPLPEDRIDDLEQVLFGDKRRNRFRSYTVSVFDGDKMIGAGVFDLGQESAAGITSFYDPAYAKYSLGKYLIYLKMEYCKSIGMKYFYPGYFVPGLPAFDYKLTMNRETLEFYDPSKERWLDIAEYNPSYVFTDVIKAALEHYKFILQKEGLISSLVHYIPYSATAEMLGITHHLAIPYFLHLPGQHKSGSDLAITYHPFKKEYQFFQCTHLDPEDFLKNEYHTYCFTLANFVRVKKVQLFNTVG